MITFLFTHIHLSLGKHLQKVEGEESLFQLLVRLHQALYVWPGAGPGADPTCIVEVMERARCNILAYLRGLTVELMLVDQELTKGKLEQIEQVEALYSVNY